MILEWKTLDMSDSASKLYMGKHHVGTVYWDGFSTGNEDRKYRVRCTLPGVNAQLGKFKLREEAQAKLIAAVNAWILGAMEGCDD